MIVLEGFEEPAAFRGGVLAIGNFDGVHRGHQRMLQVLVERAKTHRVPAVVFTFNPPPVELLRPESVPPRLTTLETKAELLAGQGVDCLIAYPTNRELLNLEPEAFFAQIVVRQLAARGLVEGPNFYFGKNRQGDVTLLAELCRASGRDLDIIAPESQGEDLISSSKIRGLIAQGELGRAVEMLGHPYRIEGRVIPGEGRGPNFGLSHREPGRDSHADPGGWGLRGPELAGWQTLSRRHSYWFQSHLPRSGSQSGSPLARSCRGLVRAIFEDRFAGKNPQHAGVSFGAGAEKSD